MARCWTTACPPRNERVGPDGPPQRRRGMMAPLLILGWGNLSRGDDALGPQCLARWRLCLPAEHAARVDWLEDFQLQVEHALDLVGRQAVLMVDASVTAQAPFEVSQPVPRRDPSYTSHALSPQALLQVFVDVHGRPPPPVTLLAIRGESFELGEPMGAAAHDHLNQSVDWVRRWVADALARPPGGSGHA